MMQVLRSPLLVLLLAAALARADGGKTIADGVYTEEQAAAGEKLYKVQCLTCHDKRYFRPVLERWQGQSLDMIFMIMSTSMPQSNPGALPLSDYADILAYILSQSRYPAGDSELEYQGDALQDIRIVPRK